MAYDIHGYEKKLVYAQRCLENSTASEENKKIIRDFEMYLRVKGIGIPRTIRYLSTLKSMAVSLGKNFKDATKEDMVQLVYRLETNGYTEWTKKTYKSVIKRFYKWLTGNDEEYPDEVKWIQTTLPPSKRPIPRIEELLTQKEVQALVQASPSVMHQAFVMFLWESGARVSEIGNLEIGNIAFDKYGATVTLKGKTGMRAIRLFSAAVYLQNWLAIHPSNKDKHAPLWIRSDRLAPVHLSYEGIKMLIKRLYTRAGIDKKCNPHMFRHSRASFMANFMTEFQMCEYFGWEQGSDMPRIYVHLSGRNTEAHLFELHGIKVAKDRRVDLDKPLVCGDCGMINPPWHKLCGRCGHPLDTALSVDPNSLSSVSKERKNADVLMQKLLEDPYLKSIIEKKLAQIEM